MSRRLEIILCLAAAVGIGTIAASPYAKEIDDSPVVIWAGILVVLVSSAAALRAWWRHVHDLPPVPRSPWKKWFDGLLMWLPWV